MGQTFTNQQGQLILENWIQAIQANKQYLSDIDGLIGDGDHGINMNKGFTVFGQKIAAQPLDLSAGLASLSNVLMSQIGGSMGPLYGMMFRSMSKACAGVETLGADEVGKLLEAAEAGVGKVSDAQPGDKTLVDCLAPAVAAYRDAIAGEATLNEALAAMRDAAVAGRDSTNDMLARKGRSSRLGERSRGVVDAGATSCCILLETMAETITQLAH